MSTVPQFLRLVDGHGSRAVFHRDSAMNPCPCRTKQGFRNPEFHLKWDSTQPEVVLSHGGPDQFNTGYQVQYWVIDANQPFGRMNVIVPITEDGTTITLRNFPEVTWGRTISILRQVIDSFGVPTLVLLWNSWVSGSDFEITDNQAPNSGLITPVSLENIPLTCNEAGMLPDASTTAHYSIKGFVQPIQSGAVRRLPAEQIESIFGEVKSDDHIGIFPVTYNGHELDFSDWPMSTKDYVLYNGRKFTVVSANLIPDPSDGNPRHHWEVGLRLIDG